MNIIQTEGTISITSQETSGYGFIHIIQDVTIVGNNIVSDIFTTASSTYTFVADGYFIITEIKLPIAPSAGNHCINLGQEVIYNSAGNIINTQQLLDTDPQLTNIIRKDEN